MRRAATVLVALLLAMPLVPAAGFAAGDAAGDGPDGLMAYDGPLPDEMRPAQPEEDGANGVGEAGREAPEKAGGTTGGTAVGRVASSLAAPRSLMARQQVRALGLGEPGHRKILERRADGTYDLTLTVQGNVQSSQDIMKANVVVVLDVSRSMREPAGDSTRMGVARQCISSLANTLLSQNAGQPEPLVEMSLITFATTRDLVSGWFTEAAPFNSMVSGVTYRTGTFGGTNWEDALMAAKSAADAKSAASSAPTYVIFISDGLPTFRNTQGAGWNDMHSDARATYGVWGTGSDDNAQSVDRCYTMSKDDARAIVTAGHEFYGISVFDQIARVGSLVDYAYTGNDYGTDPTGTAHHYYAADQAALNQAFSEIAHNITRHVHYADVTVHDALDLRNVGFASGGPVEYVLRKELADGTVVTYDSSTGTVTGGTWNFGTPAFGADGTVSWNPEAGQGALLDDATYSITFRIAPSQQACDASADSPSLFVPGDNDGDGVDESTGLPSNVPSEAYVSYCTATVTENGGSTTVELEGPETAPYNKPVAAPDPARLTIVKHWEGDAGQAASMRPATLHGTVTRDDGKVYPVELVPAGDGTYTAAIDVPAGPQGHRYTFAEEQLPPYYEPSPVTAQASAPSTANADGSLHLAGIAGQDAAFEVTNAYIAFPLAVKKVEAGSGTPLEGARFALYQDDGDGAFDIDADPPATVFADAALTQPVDGSSLATGASGTVTFHGLLAGRNYWLIETRAPTGYNLDSAAHAIVVSAGGTMLTFDSAGEPAALPAPDGVPTIVIADEPVPDLPVTAGPGASALTVAGICLLLAGLALSSAALASQRRSESRRASPPR